MNRRLIIVFPGFPACFDEFQAAYEKAASRMEGVVIERLSEWIQNRSEWKDPNNTVVFWCQLPAVIPTDRKAKCVLYHLESSGDPAKLTRGQGEIVERFAQRARELDLLAVTTPAAKDFWSPRVSRVAVVPIGYDPDVMGIPDWSCPKTYEIGFCGTVVGRREWILPVLQDRLGKDFVVIQESGRAMREAFNGCRAMLHIAHSDEVGFPTLRLWHAISTSAALVTERRDAWPAIPNKHVLQVPPAEKNNLGLFIDALRDALQNPLEKIAQQANKELSCYTVERCIKDFMIPAIDSIRENDASGGRAPDPAYLRGTVMSHERFWEQWDPVATSMDSYWTDTPVEAWYRNAVASVIAPFIKNEQCLYLDVGCGNGLLINELVSLGVSPRSLIGVDNSPNMITLAKKRVSRGTVGIGDLFSLAYPDQSVEIVGGLNLLSHIPDMRDGLRELWRVASRVVFFTAIIGDQASTLNDFWGASKFIRNTFRVEDIKTIVTEVCGPDAILINARSFPHQRMVLFAVFKPNTSKVEAQHTIVLGSFNRPKMVKRAVQSVLAQTVRDWQLIIADDGSNDDTIRSIHEEIAGNPRILFNPCTDPCLDIVRTKASSRACMRINDALKFSTGRILHYLADDDWYDSKRLEVFNEIFADPAVHCGYGRVMLMNMDKVHGSIFPKSPCTQPLSNLDHNQVAHRAETFKIVTQWPTEEKGDYALEGHYFNMLAEHWPFVGLDKVVAYKSYHPFNMQKTRDQSTSVREL